MKALFQKYKSVLTALMAIGCLLLVFIIFNVPCLIKFTTGISCAGCGMTRAWLSALRLDLAAAFSYHPLFWAVPIALLLLLLHKRYPVFSKIVFTGLLVLDIAVYLIRIIDPSCTVVVFEPTNGLIYRIIHGLLSKVGLL